MESGVLDGRDDLVDQDGSALAGLLSSLFLFFESSGKGLGSGASLDIGGRTCMRACVELVSWANHGGD